MGPKEKIERLAQTPEDRVLLARVWERLSAGQRREIPAFSCFLSAGSRSWCAASWGEETLTFLVGIPRQSGRWPAICHPIWRRTACMLKGR